MSRLESVPLLSLGSQALSSRLEKFCVGRRPALNLNRSRVPQLSDAALSAPCKPACGAGGCHLPRPPIRLVPKRPVPLKLSARICIACSGTIVSWKVPIGFWQTASPCWRKRFVRARPALRGSSALCSACARSLLLFSDVRAFFCERGLPGRPAFRYSF